MRLIFEWDANKSLANLKKHQVSFEEAKTVFNDPLLITYRDDFHSEYEERVMSIGLSIQHRILLVVHTEQTLQSDTIILRIISCRKATAAERKFYEN